MQSTSTEEKIQQLLLNARTPFIPMPRIRCNDGFSFSVQTSEFCYCTPRDSKGPWSEVEVGFPSEAESLLEEYKELDEDATRSIFPYTPLTVVAAVIEKHGGFYEKEHSRS